MVTQVSTIEAICTSIRTPIDFDSTLGLDDMRMRQAEFEIVTGNLVQFSGDLTINIPDLVRDAVFKVTRGHPGLVRRTLDILRFQFRGGSTDVRKNATLSGLSYLSDQDYGVACNVLGLGKHL